jgi:hypothetical protein
MSVISRINEYIKDENQFLASLLEIERTCALDTDSPTKRDLTETIERSQARIVKLEAERRAYLIKEVITSFRNRGTA